MDWLDILKSTASKVKRIGDVDLYNQLIELQDAVMNVKQENYKLVEENIKLKELLAKKNEGPLEPTEIEDVYKIL